MPDWRDNYGWPTPYAEIRRQQQDLLSRYMSILAALTDETERAVAILAGHSFLANITPALSAALAVQDEARFDGELVGEAPEFGFLRAKSWSDPPRLLGAAHSKPISSPRAQWLRRVLRTASWTNYRDLPTTLLAPRSIAISHNKLLQRNARNRGRIGFRHADSILGEARRRNAKPAVDCEALASRISELTADVLELDADLRIGLACLASNELAPLLRLAARDLQGLRESRTLPNDIWAGTGGYWPSRAVGLEVLRRGGEVTRFSHNGCEVLVSDRREIFPLIEMCASSKFVFGTEQVARLARETGVTEPVASYRPIEFLHGDGLPPFDTIELKPSAGRQAGPPKVLFAPSVLVGQRGIFPPLLPDVLSLDWQLRLAELLQNLPIELLCKPHPEGILKGQPQPVAAIARVSMVPFEELLDWPDVFIFDRAESTTFWEAVCTRKRVILLDCGQTEFIPQIEPLIRDRCTILPVAYDVRNRPVVASEALSDAIFTDPGPVDPTPIHDLLAGTGH